MSFFLEGLKLKKKAIMLGITVTNYFLEQQAIVERNWQISKESQDIDAIHDMRVGIKRLRTLYQFLDAISNGVFNYQLHFKELKLLFKAAGRLRDLQLQSHLFSTYQTDYPKKDFITFYQYLQQQHEQESKNFEAAVYRFQIEGLNDSLRDAQLFLQSIDKEAAQTAALQLLEKRLKQAYSVRAKVKKGRGDELHKMRTRLKQTAYLDELISLFYSNEQQFLKGRKRLKKLGNYLGDWHDKQVLLEQLYRFRHFCSRQEIKAYKKLIKRVRLEVKTALEQSLELMDHKPIKLIHSKAMNISGTQY
jgi:CHAD domain-containing protein